MSHYDEGVLHAMLDGEIGSSELEAIRRHLAECAECRGRLAECQALRTEAFDLIETLEAPEAVAAEAGPLFHEPMPMFSRAAEAAAPAAYAAMPDPPRQIAASASVTPIASRRRRWPLGLAWAATVVLAAGVGYFGAARRLTDAGQRQAAREEMSLAASKDAAANVVAPVPAPVAAVNEPPAVSDNAKVKPAAPAATAPARVLRRQAAPAPPKAEAGAASGKLVDALEKKQDAAVAKAAAPVEQHKEARAQERDQDAADSTVAAGRANARRFDTSKLKLDELVVTGTAETAARKRTLGSDQRTRVVTADEAIRTLGGSIRLVDGLEPARYEVTGAAVRVIYSVPWGALVLQEHREGSTIVAELVAPEGTPPDSLAVWRGRIK